jgi:CHAD domain-containing protein
MAAAINHDLGHVRRLAGKLRENLAKCGDDPDVDPVHDTRTGTRRLQATLEELVRQSPGGGARDSGRVVASAMMKTLKKIRRAAAPVRDLDVHRKLLDKLVRRSAEPRAGEKAEKLTGPAGIVVPDVLEATEAGLRLTGIERQGKDLDAWLRNRRGEHAEEFKAEVPELLKRFDKRLEELTTELQTNRVQRTRAKPAGVVALDAFARLASGMQMLDASNLHDFRKGAKKARYVAELAAQGDAQARQVGETLKRLQDEIGDWHDWLVLAEEAHAALGDPGAQLIALIEKEREKHFVTAMKTAARLRGRLMGEWLAVSRRPAGRSAVAVKKHSPVAEHRAVS